MNLSKIIYFLFAVADGERLKAPIAVFAGVFIGLAYAAALSHLTSYSYLIGLLLGVIAATAFMKPDFFSND